MTRQATFIVLGTDSLRPLRAIVIAKGPRGCYRCTRRAIGTTTVGSQVENACAEHAERFEGLAH